MMPYWFHCCYFYCYNMTEIRMFDIRFSFGFPGCTHCLHRHKWAHYSLKSGYSFLFFSFCRQAFSYCTCTYLLCIMIVMHSYASIHCYSSLWRNILEAMSGRLQALPGVLFFYDLSPIKVPSCSIWLFAMSSQACAKPWVVTVAIGSMMIPIPIISSVPKHSC
jgi:hypothetical protein